MLLYQGTRRGSAADPDVSAAALGQTADTASGARLSGPQTAKVAIATNTFFCECEYQSHL